MKKLCGIEGHTHMLHIVHSATVNMGEIKSKTEDAEKNETEQCRPGQEPELESFVHSFQCAFSAHSKPNTFISSILNYKL